MITSPKMGARIKSVRWAFNCSSWSPSEKDWTMLASGLDAEDKEQVDKFVFKKDAKLAMIGRYLIKKFISEASGISWNNIKILRDSEHGKPYFVHDFEIQFNISHSGDFVVLAGEACKPNIKLGIDLMKVEKQRTTSVPEFFRLMSKQFAAEEWAVVKCQLTEAEQMAMFYRFWCLKESFTKATGTGITVDLQQICFKLNTQVLSEKSIVSDSEVYVEGKQKVEWKFEESLVSSDHIVTVAIKGSELMKITPHEDTFVHLSFSEVISQHQHISLPDVDYGRRFMMKRLHPS